MIDRAELRRQHALTETASGDQHTLALYACKDAIPVLLEQLDATEAAIRALDGELANARLMSAAMGARTEYTGRLFSEAVRKNAELETRIRIATELAVSDRQRYRQIVLDACSLLERLLPPGDPGLAMVDGWREAVTLP